MLVAMELLNLLASTSTGSAKSDDDLPYQTEACFRLSCSRTVRQGA